MDYIEHCDIIPGYRSDHSIVKMHLTINKFDRGKGTWKFNCKLLENKIYIDMVNNLIKTEILKYALPVYSIEFLENHENFDSIQFKIDYHLFLETLLLSIRGETIKFSSNLKKLNDQLEKTLLRDIEILEQSGQNIDLLYEKQDELENLRKVKIDGQIVRSRCQKLKDGEKPTKNFCSNPNKAYIEKTIKKIKLDNGQTILEQDKILEEVRSFYSFLFKNKDGDLSSKDINVILKELKAQKLSQDQSLSLEGKLTMNSQELLKI